MDYKSGFNAYFILAFYPYKLGDLDTFGFELGWKDAENLYTKLFSRT